MGPRQTSLIQGIIVSTLNLMAHVDESTAVGAVTVTGAGSTFQVNAGFSLTQGATLNNGGTLDNFGNVTGPVDGVISNTGGGKRAAGLSDS